MPTTVRSTFGPSGWPKPTPNWVTSSGVSSLTGTTSPRWTPFSWARISGTITSNGASSRGARPCTSTGENRSGSRGGPLETLTYWTTGAPSTWPMTWDERHDFTTPGSRSTSSGRTESAKISTRPSSRWLAAASRSYAVAVRVATAAAAATTPATRPASSPTTTIDRQRVRSSTRATARTAAHGTDTMAGHRTTGHQPARTGTGTSARTTVPRPGTVSTRTVPPTAPTRSVMFCRPWPAASAPGS